MKLATNALMSLTLSLLACGGSTTPPDGGTCSTWVSPSPPTVAHLRLDFRPNLMGRDLEIRDLAVQIVPYTPGMAQPMSGLARAPGGGWTTATTTITAYGGEVVFYINWNEILPSGDPILTRFGRLTQDTETLIVEGELRILELGGGEWHAIFVHSDMYGLVLKARWDEQCSRTDAYSGSVCLTR